jgi:beta-glucosidase
LRAAYCAAVLLAVAPGARSAAAVHPEAWPPVAPPLAADAQLEARIDQLLARLSRAQQVAQLIQGDIGSFRPEDLRDCPLGSVLNGGDSAPGGNKLAAPREWLALADRFYDAAMTGSGAVGIPLLWGTDAVHGHNNIPGATIFPHNIGLGAAHDVELVRRIGAVTALEVRVTGLDWAFAPTLAVTRDLRWGRSYESYSSDPALVSRYARAMVEGLQGVPGSAQFLDGAHVLATAKHFIGDGATRDGRDEGDDPDTERQLITVDAPPYVAALRAAAQTVMVSYSSWQGQKMHGNRALLSDVLKQRMGFDGLVISDWNGYAQLPGCTPSACPAAFAAGIDVLMSATDWRALQAHTLAAVSAGELPAARVTDAVRRVLRVKLRAGLDREGRPSARPYAGHFELLGAPAHRALARQAVRESLVLLKNRNHLLPLSPRARVLVAGDAADSLARQSGGWTINWQGGEPNSAFGHGETVYAGIAQLLQAGGGSAELSADGTFRTRPDVAIVVFGEPPYAEYRGDLTTLAYSPGDRQQLRLLEQLHAQHIPVVAVLLAGRPLMVNDELAAADSFVAAWLPGTEGAGIADVLIAGSDGRPRYDFRGRLPFAWPRSAQPGPAERPLFARGYGLHYGAAAPRD